MKHKGFFIFNHYIIKSLCFVIVTLQLFSCEYSEGLILCEDGVSIEKRMYTLCEPKIMSYHFGVEKLDIQQQTQALKNIGMDGMMLNVTTNSIDQINEYYLTKEVQEGAFQIYDLFTSINLDDPAMTETQIATIDAIYKHIYCTETVLQVIFLGGKENNIETTISRLSDIANNYNKEVVIYLHYETAIETAEDALKHIRATGKNNVFLSVHLCHELAAGNGSRIEEVIENVAPYIKSTSISGATESEQNNESLPLWYWGIKPLSMGTYDYSTYYNKLYEVGYSGPIAIHTWGIYENFGLAVEDHLPYSKQIISDLAEAVCK